MEAAGAAVRSLSPPAAALMSPHEELSCPHTRAMGPQHGMDTPPLPRPQPPLLEGPDKMWL